MPILWMIFRKFFHGGKNFLYVKKEAHMVQIKLVPEKTDTPNELYEWQKEAIRRWMINNCRGLVEAATGTGKTFFALNCYKRIPLNKTLLIVVPTTVLQQQWQAEVKKVLGFTDDDIGLLGDGNKDTSKRVCIAIVNSLRNFPADFDMIVLDEAHRYCSPENLKAIKQLDFEYFLAMSATLRRDDNAHKELLRYARLIYFIDQKQAIAEGYNARYDVVNVGVRLGRVAQQQYDYWQTKINDNFPVFNRNYMLVQQEARSGNIMACVLMKAFNKRKAILNNSIEKVLKCGEIVKEHQNDGKIIVFNELIKVTTAVYKLLKHEGVNVGVLQSKHSAKQRKEIIVDYDSGKFNVLVCCRVLDEGLNVKDASIAIVVSGNSTTRQAIQRTGRVLRPMEGKTATLFNIYVKDTQDEVWLEKRLRGLKGYDSIKWV